MKRATAYVTAALLTVSGLLLGAYATRGLVELVSTAEAQATGSGATDTAVNRSGQPCSMSGTTAPNANVPSC